MIKIKSISDLILLNSLFLGFYKLITTWLLEEHMLKVKQISIH